MSASTGQALYPSFKAPVSAITRAASAPLLYRKSFLWDFERNDFVLDASGRPVVCDGWTAWAQWCLKTILTERFAFPAYPRSHGVEFDKIPQLSSRGLATAHIARTITDALLCDRRTGNVGKFTFTWNMDGCVVQFVASPTIGSPIIIEVNVPAQ